MEYIDSLKEEETDYINTLIERLDPTSFYPINYTIQDTMKYLKKVLSYNKPVEIYTSTSNRTRLQLLWHVNSTYIVPEEITYVLKGEELLIADDIVTYIDSALLNIEEILFNKNMMYVDIITKKNTIYNVPNTPYKCLTFDNRRIIVEFRNVLSKK